MNEPIRYVDFTFALYNNNNINNSNGKKRAHLNFLRVTVLGNKLELSSAKLSSLNWVELRLSMAMAVVMQLELILKYFKTAFKDF